MSIKHFEDVLKGTLSYKVRQLEKRGCNKVSLSFTGVKKIDDHFGNDTIIADKRLMEVFGSSLISTNSETFRVVDYNLLEQKLKDVGGEYRLHTFDGDEVEPPGPPFAILMVRVPV